MRSFSLIFIIVAAVASGCQSPAGSGNRLTAADYRNVKPATAEEEARFLAAIERLNRAAPLQVARSIDPSGLSQNAVQAAAQPDMEEVQSLMPAMMAKNKQRTAEFCAARPQMAECQEYARLVREARANGIEY